MTRKPKTSDYSLLQPNGTATNFSLPNCGGLSLKPSTFRMRFDQLAIVAHALALLVCGILLSQKGVKISGNTEIRVQLLIGMEIVVILAHVSKSLALPPLPKGPRGEVPQMGPYSQKNGRRLATHWHMQKYLSARRH